jgi:hypothetical protein
MASSSGDHVNPEIYWEIFRTSEATLGECYGGKAEWKIDYRTLTLDTSATYVRRALLLVYAVL